MTVTSSGNAFVVQFVDDQLARTKRSDFYARIFEAAIPAPCEAVAVKRSVDLAWLVQAIAAGRDVCSMGVLARLIEGLSQFLTNEAYDEIDLILRSVSVRSISPEVMLAIARTSFAARHKLAEWKRFVTAMKQELVLRGLDADRLARGLS